MVPSPVLKKKNPKRDRVTPAPETHYYNAVLRTPQELPAASAEIPLKPKGTLGLVQSFGVLP